MVLSNGKLAFFLSVLHFESKIYQKFHHLLQWAFIFLMKPTWDGGAKVCSDASDPLIKMAVMPIYGKKHLKTMFFRIKKPGAKKLGLKHQGLVAYQVCSNDGPRLFLCKSQICVPIHLYGEKHIRLVKMFQSFNGEKKLDHTMGQQFYRSSSYLLVLLAVFTQHSGGTKTHYKFILRGL